MEKTINGFVKLKTNVFPSQYEMDVFTVVPTVYVSSLIDELGTV